MTTRAQRQGEEKWNYTVVYYAILYYTILYYTTPYCTIPYHIILYHTISYYTIPYHTTLYHTIPYYTIHKVVQYHWEVSCNNLKVYTTNPKVTFKITQQRIMLISEHQQQ